MSSAEGPPPADERPPAGLTIPTKGRASEALSPPDKTSPAQAGAAARGAAGGTVAIHIPAFQTQGVLKETTAEPLSSSTQPRRYTFHGESFVPYTPRSPATVDLGTVLALIDPSVCLTDLLSKSARGPVRRAPASLKSKQHEVTPTSKLGETQVHVRQVAKLIGRARVKCDNPTSILIITKARDPQLVTLTRELTLWLTRYGDEGGLNVYVNLRCVCFFFPLAPDAALNMGLIPDEPFQVRGRESSPFLEPGPVRKEPVEVQLRRDARRRRDGPVRLLAVSTGGPAGDPVLARVAGFPDELSVRGSPGRAVESRQQRRAGESQDEVHLHGIPVRPDRGDRDGGEEGRGAGREVGEKEKGSHPAEQRGLDIGTRGGERGGSEGERTGAMRFDLFDGVQLLRAAVHDQAGNRARRARTVAGPFCQFPKRSRGLAAGPRVEPAPPPDREARARSEVHPEARGGAHVGGFRPNPALPAGPAASSRPAPNRRPDGLRHDAVRDLRDPQRSRRGPGAVAVH
ncbi:MAG: hypothetical protein BJ554DRAFT_263, partial [Olpidium bornovanus]